MIEQTKKPTAKTLGRPRRYDAPERTHLAVLNEDIERLRVLAEDDLRSMTSQISHLIRTAFAARAATKASLGPSNGRT